MHDQKHSKDGRDGEQEGLYDAGDDDEKGSRKNEGGWRRGDKKRKGGEDTRPVGLIRREPAARPACKYSKHGPTTSRKRRRTRSLSSRSVPRPQICASSPPPCLANSGHPTSVSALPRPPPHANAPKLAPPRGADPKDVYAPPDAEIPRLDPRLSFGRRPKFEGPFHRHRHPNHHEQTCRSKVLGVRLAWQHS
ncbi:hypothetical protein OF83DRAFT_844530 [Amylostereum chailletii]|nr:hypothetical protein OF83DRAFT_844530 [Amylostereum chailletii]